MSERVDPPRGGPSGSSARAADRGAGEDEGRGLLFAALEAVPTPLVLADPHQPDDPIVLANPAFLRMTGYDRSEVVGRNCRFLQGLASDPAAVDRIRGGVRARGEVAVELLNYRKDGTPFWNALSIAPVFDAAGGLVYLLASQLDVSRRREAEDALGRPRDAAGGRPLGDVAHDLNNMLQVISGHAEGLSDRAAASGDARLVRRTRAVSEAAARATALTRLILDGSRPGAAPAAEAVADDAEAAPAGSDSIVRAPTSAVEAAVARRGGRVLVVDDRAEVAELARTMLEGAGYGVEVARNGRQALEKLDSLDGPGGGFDLLFSDVVMPGGPDGVTLAREARRRFPRLKVLLTTGRTGPTPDPAGAEFASIGKPYRRAELVEAVRRLLDGPPAR